MTDLIKCRMCLKEGQGITFDDHKLCPPCLATELEETRRTLLCCRCGAAIDELDVQHYFCPKCALVLTKSRDDVIKGIADR